MTRASTTSPDLAKAEYRPASDEVRKITNRLLSMIGSGDVLLISGASNDRGIFDLALGIVQVASSMGRNAVLLDAGVADKTTVQRNGWVQVLNGQTSFDECFAEVTSGSANVVYSGSSDNAEITRMLAVDEFRALVETLRQITDLVVIATPAHSASLNAELVAITSNGAILAVHSGVDTARDINRIELGLGMMKIPLLGVVLVE